MRHRAGIMGTRHLMDMRCGAYFHGDECNERIKKTSKPYLLAMKLKVVMQNATVAEPKYFRYSQNITFFRNCCMKCKKLKIKQRIENKQRTIHVNVALQSTHNAQHYERWDRTRGTSQVCKERYFYIYMIRYVEEDLQENMCMTKFVGQYVCDKICMTKYVG